jgi:peptidoglycan/LPS O-acetylase OafA/YrhL
LKELDKTKGGNAKFWAMYFVHRYIRLTGVYAIVIGLHATLLKFFATGVQSSAVSNAVGNCQETWWANLLYLNNLHWVAPTDKPMDCMGVTW